VIVKNPAVFLVLGLTACLAWSACSCSRGPYLTDEQKRGLEVLARVANPDPLELRWHQSHNRLMERSIADSSLEEKRLGVYEASEALDAEFDRRKAGGELTDELVSWYEAETLRTDAEIVARWKP